MAWTVDGWDRIPGLVHAFGTKSDPVPRDVVTLRQVHGRRLLDARRAVAPDAEGDALLTAASEPRRIGVWTADCVPVLLVAPAVRAAAAVHSGWRGTLAGVVEEAIGAFRREWAVEPGGVEMALGPAIGGCCYEVGPDVVGPLRERHPGLTAEAVREKGDRFHLDLRHFLARRAGELGVGRVETVGPCTACTPGQLWSRRRQGGSGRQLSFIGFVAGPSVEEGRRG